MASSADIDAALVTLLASDATLTALLPDGVYLDEGPPGVRRFVVVSLVDEHDEAVFQGRAFEDALYLVKAVALSTAITAANAKAAEARIDVLLEDQPLNVSGYTHMAMYREERVRLTEVDESNPDLRWFHRGGRYRVQQSLTVTAFDSQAFDTGAFE